MVLSVAPPPSGVTATEAREAWLTLNPKQLPLRTQPKSNIPPL